MLHAWQREAHARLTRMVSTREVLEEVAVTGLNVRDGVCARDPTSRFAFCTSREGIRQREPALLVSV